jgi:hypothetical protein
VESTDPRNINRDGVGNNDIVVTATRYDPFRIGDVLSTLAAQTMQVWFGTLSAGDQAGSGADIVVTARRTRPHNYGIARCLTARNTICTLGQVSQAASDNSVPGSSGPHISGEIYRVSLFGISPGHIQFESAGDGRRFINATQDDHWLRLGTVVTTISGNQRDGFVAHVSGTGTNINAFWAEVNQGADPKIFSRQLSRMHAAVLRACGG